MTGLYTTDILRLAAETVLAPRLASPDSTAERRSQICGSSIIVDIAVDGKQCIVDYGHEIRACAMGQASATIFARHVKGCSLGELVTARDALARYLAGSSDVLPDWPGFEILERARSYPARHAAVRLPFEAVVDALEKVATPVGEAR